MTAENWKTGREKLGLTQASAALSLGVSQPYLSQLETGLRVGSVKLTQKAAKLYGLPPTALPLPHEPVVTESSPKDLEGKLASLGYPGFEHVRSNVESNPAQVVLDAVTRRDLDVRLVEALPWVLSTYTDLPWDWLRDGAKLRNAQNRLGYLIHLAGEVVTTMPHLPNAANVLSKWEQELEEARLAHEGTLCRDSMPERERSWLRTNRPHAAAHWNLLTNLRADQLPYGTQ
jgi:transcriptional regulator with XRE-family HTH domain